MTNSAAKRESSQHCALKAEIKYLLCYKVSKEYMDQNLTKYKGPFGETKEKILEMLLDGPKSSVEIADTL
ncbi:MAG TPA: hypothetical protein VFY50_01895 [Candidatus Nitrosocosmicus sp.]|nr:hypothetical protein [Candidatus Nitrosocosmicus sp.]